VTVACPPGSHGRQLFRVYVLELSDGSLYVGSTAQTLEERLREHREGGGRRSGRVLAYRRLRRDLCPQAMCATRERAERIEERLAARLRARGFEVRQA
jgi:predicted GIY-YIG superfamily endonuclease